MPGEPDSASAARNAGLARIRTLTRAAVVGAALLSGVFAGFAAAWTHGQATHAGTPSAPLVSSSTEAPALAAPWQAPRQSTEQPVTSSGGS